MPTAEAIMNNNPAMKASSPTNTMTSMSDNSMMNYTTVASNRRVTASGGNGNASNGNRNRGGNGGESGRLLQDQKSASMSMNHGHNLHGNSGGGADSGNTNTAARDVHGWSRGGRQFASSREVYSRSLHRICLKFTTSEDEDEGKPEPATAYWTFYGRQTTIGNGGPGSPKPDDICRRMDDSMSGPAAGALSRVTDHDGEPAAMHSMRAGLTCAWQVRGERGDVAIRVGKARVANTPNGDGAAKNVAILSLDANRWVLCKGASFAAGNSVFSVEDFNDTKGLISIHCLRGPMRGKIIEVSANRCPYIFGRAHEADLCIMDRELSRKHGAILYLPGTGKKNIGGANPSANIGSGSFILVDLESTVSFSILTFLSKYYFLE